MVEGVGSSIVAASPICTCSAFSVPPSVSFPVTESRWYIIAREALVATVTFAYARSTPFDPNHLASINVSKVFRSTSESLFVNTRHSAILCPPYKLLRSMANALQCAFALPAYTFCGSIVTRCIPSGYASVVGLDTAFPSHQNFVPLPAPAPAWM